MMSRLPLLLAILALSCGRDQVGLLGGGDGDGGVRKDGFIGGTDGPFLSDRPDAFIPDRMLFDGGGLECDRPRDCRMKYGPPPPCPSGDPGNWQCTPEGLCQSECAPAECMNDCDC